MQNLPPAPSLAPPITLPGFYNTIMQPRGISFPTHLNPVATALADKRIGKLMLVIGPGCCFSETIIWVSRPSIPGYQPKTIESLFTEQQNNPDEFNAHTASHGENDYLYFNKIVKVLQSGVKELFRVESVSGHVVRVSAEHPFLVPVGTVGADSESYKQLKDLSVGDVVFVNQAFNKIIKTTIQSIESTGSDMTYDLVMADPYRNYLANGFVVHNSGKSLLLSVVYPAYVLGLDPTHTIIDVSASEGLAQGFMQATMEIVDKSPHYKRLFPNTRPDKKAGWSLDRGIYTTARIPGDPDSSYRAAGLTSKQLVGKHAKLMILDDLHDQENSSSIGACEKVISAYYQNLLGRADPQGARFLLAGRRWSEWDIYGHLIESEDWVTMRLPAERGLGETSLYYDVYVPPNLECCFTEGGAKEVKSNNPKYRQFNAYYGIDPQLQGFYWPSSPHKRQEYFSVKRNRPAEAASVYQGQPGGRNSGVFLDSDFRLVKLGTFDRLTPERIPSYLMPAGSRIVQGWDIAHTQNEKSDFSVCVTAILTPCREWHNWEKVDLLGEADNHYDVLVVDVFKAKLEFGGLVSKMREMAQEWAPSFIPVERNTGSIPIIQSLSNMIPINPMSLRNMSKRARATISISAGTASVQGWLRQGRVKFWEEAPWLAEVRQEMLDFTGDQTGHDDIVDAMIYTITQAILLGAGVAMLPSGASDGPSADENIQPYITEALASRNAGFALINEIAKSQTPTPTALLAPNQAPSYLNLNQPEIQLCKNCRYRDTMTSMCIVQNRKVVAIDSCPKWAWDGSV